MEFKIVLVGDAGVGKTTYITRISSGEYNKKYIPTLGVDVFSLCLNSNKGYIKFNIWDISGGEKVGALRDSYYNHTDAAILFYDISDKESFNHVREWYNDFKRDNKSPVVICGTKSDLKNMSRVNGMFLKFCLEK